MTGGLGAYFLQFRLDRAQQGSSGEGPIQFIGEAKNRPMVFINFRHAYGVMIRAPFKALHGIIITRF